MKRFLNMLSVTEAAGEDTDGLDRAVTLAEQNQANLPVASLLEGMPTHQMGQARIIAADRDFVGKNSSLADKF